MATFGFEDLQLYREMARTADERFLQEQPAGNALQEKAADVLRSRAAQFPGIVEPKYWAKSTRLDESTSARSAAGVADLGK